MQAHAAGGVSLAAADRDWESELERLLEPAARLDTAQRGQAWVERHSAEVSVRALLDAVEAWTR
jgi:hypothetical protein